MLSIRFHGRGGQGTVVASKVLAVALFREGWQVQAFPSFGAERSGAPVAAFLRADHVPVTDHYQVYTPDHVVVLDAALLRHIDVCAGLRPGGWVLVNARVRPEQLGLPSGFGLATCDATVIALRHGLGARTSPIVNTAILGAFSAVTRLVSLGSILAAIEEVAPPKLEANQAAAREAADAVVLAPTRPVPIESPAVSGT